MFAVAFPDPRFPSPLQDTTVDFTRAVPNNVAFQVKAVGLHMWDRALVRQDYYAADVAGTQPARWYSKVLHSHFGFELE